MYLNNLVGFWDMSTINPVNLAPRTYGTGNGTGTGIAAANIVNGVGGGKGTLYNGTDELTTISNNSNLVFGNGTSDNPFSIATWVKATDWSNFTIVGKGIHGTDGEYRLKTSATDKIQFYLSDESETDYIARYYNAGLTSHEGQWVFITATYDGSSAVTGLKIYLNESRIDDTSLAGGSYVAMTDESADLIIGEYDGDYASGVMDYFMIFNFELAQTQVIDLMNRTRTGRL